MRFALIIPALNEEQAIAGTLRRALAARAKVMAETPVRAMTVVFVNDGSTDRTQEIVDQPEFAEVVKVHFEKNRGYGAAIKAGFAATEAELVGFIDADGTCDPDFCVRLVNELVRQDADVALAARLAPGSQMPLIRQVGNRIFATLLGVMSGHTGITDTASGFRVLRRSALKLLTPLPDGLHYTPTMSSICLLDPRLRIVEVSGMPYKEREGRSKLRVIQDGFRFLWTITFAACCYAPIKTMLMAAGVAGVVLALAAILLLALAGAVRAALLAGAAAVLAVMLLLSAGLVAHELNFLLIGPRRRVGPVERFLQAAMDHRKLIVGGGILSVLGAAGMLAAGLAVGGMDLFGWILALTVLTLLGLDAALVGVLVRVIWAVGEKQKALTADEFAPREPVPRSAPTGPGRNQTEQGAPAVRPLTTAP